jgi:RES domain-containing protein
VIYPPEMLDILQAAAVSVRATVYRHMFGAHPPARSNITGARWNAPGLDAIYTSCERETALAEAEYYIGLQPLRPKARRVLYTIRVSVNSVIDLTAPGLLAGLGITADVLARPDHEPCRVIGSAVTWLGHDGLLVPSARRAGGTNLVLYKQDPPPDVFHVLSEEVIASDER